MRKTYHSVILPMPLDDVWHQLESHLPGGKGSWGGQANDNRQFINAVFWIIRIGAPWRDLPPNYGPVG